MRASPDCRQSHNENIVITNFAIRKWARRRRLFISFLFSSSRNRLWILIVTVQYVNYINSFFFFFYVIFVYYWIIVFVSTYAANALLITIIISITFINYVHCIYLSHVDRSFSENKAFFFSFGFVFIYFCYYS